MAFKFKGIAPSALKAAPIPAPRVIQPTAAGAREVAQHMRLAEANDAIVTQVLEAKQPPAYIPPHTESTNVDSPAEPTQADLQAALDHEMHDSNRKLSRLLDHDFPFDPSQLEAIHGLSTQQYGCMTGAAGTGKTTSTKAVVDRLLDSVGAVDMTQYFKKGYQPEDPDDDDYDLPESFVPSICIAAFTGKASQMVKKNFPRDWHGNIMTIHRMLAYVPEFYEDWSPEHNEFRNKMRFVPTYHSGLKMPWDIILLDEAGMISIDLWENVWAALKPGARVIMIGDINQLPPVHGRSIFGFAMTKWPSWELTTIHRQEGVNNSIVENAWRILQGRTPKSDSPAELKLSLMDKESTVKSLTWMVQNKDWKSLLLQVPDEPNACSRRIRQSLKLLQDKFYDPIRDTVITAINGHDGAQGYQLGQLPMNRELAVSLNQVGQRFFIDAGRERKNFAIGDKVMATKNDHEAGITNGMTGIVTHIARNGGYAGDAQRFGTVEEVAEYLGESAHDDEPDFTLDDISESMAAQSEGREKAKESRDRGPASHIVTVRFGEGDHAFDIHFGSLAEVASLMTAYVVTCHKMQGGESPHVFTIAHHVHKQMLYREWLYTAWTRASEKSVLLYTPFGLRTGLNKQRVKGTTLADKVKSFQALQKDHGAGATVRVQLAEPVSLSKDLATTPKPPTHRSEATDQHSPREDTTKPEIRERIIERVIIQEIHHHHHEAAPKVEPEERVTKDGGDLTPWKAEAAKEIEKMQSRIFPSYQKLRGREIIPVSHVTTVFSAGRPEQKLLTHNPIQQTEPIKPTVVGSVAPTILKGFKFGGKKS
jgi:hypothetical protein